MIMKIMIFSVYFGKLPNYFELWIKSCEKNTNIQFRVITDDRRGYLLPSNVSIEYMTFESFRDKVQKCFDFEISLNVPYKLCDFKPAYGYIFEEYLKGYDYWGYADLDMIFGDITRFLPNGQYDKISHLAHLCLIRNTYENNRLFIIVKYQFVFILCNIFLQLIIRTFCLQMFILRSMK